MELKELEGKSREFNGICHDCGKEVEVRVAVNTEGTIKITGGAVYKIKQGIETGMFFKCDSCFEKDHILYWQDCDVYSRVVGYYRPVKHWNKGKAAEWDKRKEFVIQNDP
jgi:transcription elongation factor Elf1